jgi:hypothetical protein
MRSSFMKKPLPNSTQSLTGTLSAVRTPLLSSMLKLIVRSHRSLELHTVGPPGRTRLASSYFDNSLLS